MDKLVCKCGASTYEQHMKRSTSPHMFSPSKASGQIRK